MSTKAVKKSSSHRDKIKSISRPLNEFDKSNTDGMWRLLHIIAEDAQDPVGMKFYERVFQNLCKKLSGCDCENHCTKMLEETPIESWFYMTIPDISRGIKGEIALDEKGIPVGCLDHSFHCHNLVNERLGRKTYTFEELRPLYRKPMKPCTRETEADDTYSASNILIAGQNDDADDGDDGEKTFSILQLYPRFPNLFEESVRPPVRVSEQTTTKSQSTRSKASVKSKRNTSPHRPLNTRNSKHGSHEKHRKNYHGK